jgi:glycerophosphoryl diester phosphodiesterase
MGTWQMISRFGSDCPLLVLGHRGGRGEWRENTREAFAAALHAGADGVELDVRLSADGVVVVHHDREVDGTGPVDTSEAASLPDWVPTLREALEACAGAFVNVELKNSPFEVGYDPEEQLAEEVVRVLAGARSGHDVRGGLLVSSFSPASLTATKGAARRFGESIPLGLLVHPALGMEGALETAKSIGCASLNLFHAQVSSEVVLEAHEAGMAVFVWTVNSSAEVEAAVQAGVDALITDDVRSVLGFLGRLPGLP